MICGTKRDASVLRKRRLDLLVPEIAAGDEAHSQGVQALLVDLDGIVVLGALRVGARHQRVAVAAARTAGCQFEGVAAITPSTARR